MGINLIAVGGYSEVGRNMTALEIDDEIIILDMGLNIPAIVGLEENQELLSTEDMIRVKAIIIGHPHLDHLAATPYLLKNYKDAQVIGTQYTINVMKKIIKDKNRK